MIQKRKKEKKYKANWPTRVTLILNVFFSRWPNPTKGGPTSPPPPPNKFFVCVCVCARNEENSFERISLLATHH